MKHLLTAAPIVIASAIMSPALANDSEGGLTATGGLEFLRNEHIRIVSEDLLVSPELIRVEYTYENTHVEDIQIQVAFPIQVGLWGGTYSAEEVVRQLEFKTWVNGEPIEWFPYFGANFENEALCRNLWITRNQIFDDYGYCFTTLSGGILFDNSDCTSESVSLNRMDRERVAAIRDAESQNNCSVEPSIQAITPFKSTELVNAEDYVSIVRSQTFPANSLTKVVHEYRPDVGRSVPWKIWREPPSLRSEVDWGPEDDDAGEFEIMLGCTSLSEYNSAIEVWKSKGKFKPTIGEQPTAWMLFDSWLTYILVTGANWNGNIENFRLEIHTEERQIINTCFEGLQRVSDTSLVFEAKNFVPNQNLHVNFYHLERH